VIGNLIRCSCAVTSATRATPSKVQASILFEAPMLLAAPRLLLITALLIASIARAEDVLLFRGEHIRTAGKPQLGAAIVNVEIPSPELNVHLLRHIPGQTT
jgi:hypothetical protein